jgi:hypothetical protein
MRMKRKTVSRMATIKRMRHPKRKKRRSPLSRLKRARLSADRRSSFR